MSLVERSRSCDLQDAGGGGDGVCAAREAECWFEV